MKRSSGRLRKGFISTYFLSILLYCSAFLAVLLWNDQARLQTVMNMKENDVYFLQELSVISDVRCRLQKETLQKGVYLTEEGYSYHLDVQNKRIYAEIQTADPETLCIVYDPEKREFLDIDVTRPDRKG